MILSCCCSSFWCVLVPGRTGKIKSLQKKKKKAEGGGDEPNLCYLCGPARSRDCCIEVTSALPLAAADS